MRKYIVMNPEGFSGVKRDDEIEFESSDEVNAAIQAGAILTSLPDPLPEDISFPWGPIEGV